MERSFRGFGAGAGKIVAGPFAQIHRLAGRITIDVARAVGDRPIEGDLPAGALRTGARVWINGIGRSNLEGDARKQRPYEDGDKARLFFSLFISSLTNIFSIIVNSSIAIAKRLVSSSL